MCFTLKDGRMVIIKHIAKEDYDRFDNYKYYFMWRLEIQKYLSSFYKEEDLETFKQKYYDALSKPNENIDIGAFHEGKLIGIVCAFIKFGNPKQGHVAKWGVNIKKEFHNQGLGTKLLETMEIVARLRGLKRLEATYAEGNGSAEHLYLNKLGYIKEGIQENKTCIDGEYQNVILIGKLLEREFIREEGCEFCDILNFTEGMDKRLEPEGCKAIGITPHKVKGIKDPRIRALSLLIVPKNHYETIFDIPEDELFHMMQLLKKISTKLREEDHVEGINILHASGGAAQQSVKHFHFHILPRYEDDCVDAWPREELKSLII